MASTPQNTSITSNLQNIPQEKPIKIAILDLDRCLFDLRTGDIAEAMQKILKEGGYTHYVFCTSRSTANIFAPFSLGPPPAKTYESWLHAMVENTKNLNFTIANLQKRMAELFPDCISLGISTADDFHPQKNGTILGFGQGYEKIMQRYEKELETPSQLNITKVTENLEKINMELSAKHTEEKKSNNTSFEDDEDIEFQEAMKRLQQQSSSSSSSSNNIFKKEELLSNFKDLREKMAQEDIPHPNNVLEYLVSHHKLNTLIAAKRNGADVSEDEISKLKEEVKTFSAYHFSTKNVQLTMIAEMIDQKFSDKKVTIDYFDDTERHLNTAANSLNINTLFPSKCVTKFTCQKFDCFTPNLPLEECGAISSQPSWPSYVLKNVSEDPSQLLYEIQEINPTVKEKLSLPSSSRQIFLGKHRSNSVHNTGNTSSEDLGNGQLCISP